MSKSKGNMLRKPRSKSEDVIWPTPQHSELEDEFEEDQLLLPNSLKSNDDFQEFIGNTKSRNDMRGSKTSLRSLPSKAMSSFKFAKNSRSKTNIKENAQRAIALRGEYNEWSGFYMTSRLIGFDIEVWWRKSHMRTRINVMLLLLLLVFALMYLVAAIMCIRTHFRQKIKSPYDCETRDCKKAATWLKSAMRPEKDPCHNFYEFMCGHYHKEGETGKEGDWMAEIVTKPAFKVEFGENSMLAKLLQNFHNNPSYDQPIKYYQACLNEPSRKQFGLTAFVDGVKAIFGTKDFSTFESTTLTMEEIGANMLRHAGDGCFLNFAFYTYPYIMILRPSLKLQTILENPNEELTKRVFQKLLPLLNTNEQAQIDESVQGVRLMSTILRLTYKFKDIQMEKDLITGPLPSDFLFIYNTYFSNPGLCPPMGVQLDLEKILGLYLEDNYRLQFFDLAALKYFRLLKLCFSEPPSKFTYFQPTRQKTAFVAPWLFSFFWDFLLEMDTKDLMDEWKINQTHLPNNYLVRLKTDEADHHDELRCMIALCKFLGYLPSIRFLASIEKDPTVYLQIKKDEIIQYFDRVARLFADIPDSEIDTNSRKLGELIFGRGLFVDIIQPVVNGVVDETSAEDRLQIGDDHLKNSIKGIEYTIEKARQNWLGSSDTQPNIRWWGYGEPNQIQQELFDIRDGFVLSPEFVETYRAANDEKWERFLGRRFQNYILLPLTMFDEPHIDETLFLQFSQVIFEMIRMFYSLLESPFNNRYAFLRRTDDPNLYRPNRYTDDWTKLIFYGDPVKTHDRKCSLLANAKVEDIDPSLLYKEPYEMNHSLTTGGYTWNYHENYLSVLALKQAFKLLQETKSNHSKEPFNWSVPPQDRKIRVQKRLHDNILGKYTEEQLFFMAFVRTTCRGSWKTDQDELREKRFHLEITVLSILMQMEEFQKVWNCKKTDLMSNWGKPRCVHYVP